MTEQIVEATMSFRFSALILALLLLCGASASAQHTVFRFDRHMASSGNPGSMFWWEYRVTKAGDATLVGAWHHDAGMNAPGKKWYFTLTGRPEDRTGDEAHMASPVSKAFLSECADAAKAEMQLFGRDRFALVLTYTDSPTESTTSTEPLVE